MAPKLHVILCSTRPGRVGLTIGKWFHEFATQHGKFEVRLVDLAELNLPLMDEPEHPVRRLYQHEHTKAWSAIVNAADAYVFVTPEYNHGPPPALVNALDYVFHEWAYKPAGFVSYGGLSGGLRAVQVEKQSLVALKVMPIPEQVAIQMYAQYLDANKNFTPSEHHTKAATTLLNELLRWAEALKPLRESAK
ncbi:NADPH-dependent FMN reductase [Hyalangium rubrum]|uniref:NAD(P)H-dependent oxidoreductase n=1 Tax=Hyalangium rubrum TaxID=3103134 RepID=A0ABU5HG36_9BACT|nr:NAD(P)H-dependent oxidoreductase [Hyalangium sp. s54d21]MDY7232430.1 NAD(P)H-dependent oxidoreductase [Hyalangium sp. s54d21]